MPAVTLPCFACRAHRPAAAVATLDDGRQLGLCGQCLTERAHRTTFVAAFQAHAHATALAAGYARHPGAPAPALAVPA